MPDFEQVRVFENSTQIIFSVNKIGSTSASSYEQNGQGLISDEDALYEAKHRHLMEYTYEHIYGVKHE